MARIAWIAENGDQFKTEQEALDCDKLYLDSNIAKAKQEIQAIKSDVSKLESNKNRVQERWQKELKLLTDRFECELSHASKELDAGLKDLAWWEDKLSELERCKSTLAKSDRTKR